MNQTNHKALILSIPMILAVLLLGGWLLLREPKSVPESQNPPVGVENPSQMAPADFAKYNKTLPRHKVTGVKDLEGPYKKVTVSNGAITFSFEVPDKWLTETRNSGEVQMNEEELRDFLGTNYDGDIRSKEVCTNEEVYGPNGKMTIEKFCGKPYSDYADADWDTLKSMSYEDMRKEFEVRGDFYPGFPNATVTPDNKIWYTDTGWDQVNFYVVSKQEGIRYLENDKKSLARHLQNQEPELRKKIETKWENQIVGSRKALVALYSMDITKEGKYFVSKGGTGGRKYFIEVNDALTLILQKEAYVEGEFEEGFKHLIDTLSFE